MLFNDEKVVKSGDAEEMGKFAYVGRSLFLEDSNARQVRVLFQEGLNGPDLEMSADV